MFFKAIKIYEARPSEPRLKGPKFFKFWVRQIVIELVLFFNPGPKIEGLTLI